MRRECEPCHLARRTTAAIRALVAVELVDASADLLRVDDVAQRSPRVQDLRDFVRDLLRALGDGLAGEVGDLLLHVLREDVNLWRGHAG